MRDIILKNVKEGILKNFDITIPKEKFIVITGISGSGKSTFAIDTLYMESQRHYLEAIGMQGIGKPKIDSAMNLNPAIMVSQKDSVRNPRSTLGTLTNIYTDLRMIYEKLHERNCPNCKSRIKSNECKEETLVINGEFKVFMYCNKCNYKMDKLTRSHFSFNTKEGACIKCEGLGKTREINIDSLIDKNLSIEQGGVKIWEKGYREYMIDSLFKSYDFLSLEKVTNKKIDQYSKIHLEILLNGIENMELSSLIGDKKIPKNISDGRFEGLIPSIKKKIQLKGSISDKLEKVFNMKICSECMGEGLNPLASSVTINGKRLPELSNYSLIELSNWLEDLKNDFDDKLLETIKPYILDLETILKRIIKMGIGYLGISRQSNTLSGGEYQRIKLSSMLDSTMSGLTYILDEPTIGLHSIDTMGLIDNLKELRDMGNTVILIEHDLDIIKNADYLIDFGPFSGKNGGYVVFQGNPKDIEKSINSITKNYINKIFNLKEEPRISKSVLTINNLSKNNLKIDKVSFPIGNLTCVCGVSGSGKSSLVFDELYENLIYPQGKIETDISFDSIICIDQDSSVRNKRSNIATYSGIYDHIRKIFASTKNAKELNFNIKHFSFNTKGGRCENCEGLGYVTSNMLFFENMDVVCPICNGNRFDKEVLSILYKGKNIKDVLDLSVVEAMELFVSLSSIYEPLRLLEEIGLGYVELGQTLNTLSGGEIQRLKLARELSKRSIKNSLLLIDEPTTGLHPYDIEKFMILLDKIIDNGNSAIVIEHNLQFIANCDYVIDLGPGGGINGGEIIAYGSPKELSENLESKTGQFLIKI